VKPFLIRAGAALALVLGGLLTGYLLVAGERKALEEELAAKTESCSTETAELQAQLDAKGHEVAVRDAVLLLYRTHADLRSANYGIAQGRLQSAEEALARASENAPENLGGKLQDAKVKTSEIQTAITAQDPASAEQVNKLIQALTP
jgi:hypothetical protein